MKYWMLRVWSIAFLVVSVYFLWNEDQVYRWPTALVLIGFDLWVSTQLTLWIENKTFIEYVKSKDSVYFPHWVIAICSFVTYGQLFLVPLFINTCKTLLGIFVVMCVRELLGLVCEYMSNYYVRKSEEKK